MKHPGKDLRAVVFDLDGTLVDTADDFVPTVQTLRKEQGLAPMDEALIRSSVSNGSRALVTLALSLEESDAGFEGHRQRLLSLYADILGSHARLYPGLDALIDELETRQIGWGIATNKPREYTVPLLEMLGLRPAVVICPDDVSAPKPHPESLHKACAVLQCREQQTVYVGDHARDIEAGRRAGVYTIAAAYGYIEDGDSADAWGADLIVDSSEALRAALLTH